MKKPIVSFLVAALLSSGLAFSFAGCSSTATHQSTGEYIDDTAITAKVKTALLKDDIVKGLDVQVETYRGSVQLSGFVDNDTQRERAEAIAAGIGGVKEVVNNMQLKPLN